MRHSFRYNFGTFEGAEISLIFHVSDTRQSCLCFTRSALQAGGHRFDPGHVHQSYSQTGIMTASALANAKAFEFLGVTECIRHSAACARAGGSAR